MKATPVIKPGDLVSLIGGLSAPSVVGISGYGGSEKSTLATWLTGAVALTDPLGSVSVAERNVIDPVGRPTRLLRRSQGSNLHLR